MISGGTRGTLDVSEAARDRRRDLICAEPQPANAKRAYLAQMHAAFDRYIQQVSDAAKVVSEQAGQQHPRASEAIATLAPFILPEPVDPLLAAITDAYDVVWEGQDGMCREDIIQGLTDELKARGLKIVEAK